MTRAVSINQTFSWTVCEPDGGTVHNFTYSRSDYGNHNFVEHEAARDDMVSGDDFDNEGEEPDEEKLLTLTKAQRLEKKRHEGLTAVDAAKVARARQSLFCRASTSPGEANGS